MAAAENLRVAVITPYYRFERDWLETCYESVRAQTHPCTHIFVADGVPSDAVAALDVQHIVLPVRHADWGDTPRAIGSVSAVSQGFDAICYLDVDNWYEPEHVESLTDLARETGAAVCSSGRRLYRADGSLLGDCIEVDGETFVDTNCYYMTRKAYPILHAWYLMPPQYHAAGDRVVLEAIKRRKLARSHTGRATVAYRTTYAHHYQQFGEPPPADAKTKPTIVP
ncbi:MAG: glycosyl transferase [Rhodospirillaceae bacterium]|nr:glycosyl transferase [Rhodospirillaceae bacterium]